MEEPNCRTELKWETYINKVIKKIKSKGKKMFDPLNKAGAEFKAAIFE